MLEFLDAVAGTEPIREVKRRATRALALTPGDRVLDIGCGTGVDLDEMLAPTLPGGEVTGIDVSEIAVARAAGRAARANIRVEVGDVHDLPYADASFDAARADRVLLHVEQPDRALAETRRVLGAGGRLAILELVVDLAAPPELLEDPVNEAIGERFWTSGEHRDDINFFLPLLLSQAGFESVGVDRDQIETADFEAADLILRLRPGVDDAVAAGRVSASNGAAWLSAVARAMSEGTAAARVSYLCHLARAAG